MSINLSVVIPVHNGVPYVTEAIHSLLNQHTAAAEIVVRDNSSTDETIGILEALAKPGHIKLIKAQRYTSCFESWNEAVQASSGDWVCILGHDDRLQPEFVQTVTSIIAKNPNVEMILLKHRLIDSRGTCLSVSGKVPTAWPARGPLTRAEFLDRITNPGMFFTPSGVVFTRRLFDRLHGFDLRYPHAADWDLYIRAGISAEIYSEPTELVDYRVHERQGTYRFLAKDHGDSNVMFQKLPDLAPQLSPEQLAGLVRSMTDQTRRIVTLQLLGRAVAAVDVVKTRREACITIDRWRTSGNPGARYVTTTPRTLRQCAAWYSAKYVPVIHLVRAGVTLLHRSKLIVRR